MCDKNVWLCHLSHCFINTYAIGATYDGIFDYRTYRNNELMLITEPNNNSLREYNEKMWQALRTLMSGTEFKKPPVFPTSLWVEKSLQEFPKEDEYLFWANGKPVLSQECATIFTNAHLGENILTPVKIYEVETGNLFSDKEFYVLHLVEHRQYVTYPQTDPIFRFLPYKEGGGIYSKGVDVANYSLELNREAMESNVDLWHDPLLRESYFISEELYQALKRANMIEKFNALFCKII